METINTVQEGPKWTLNFKIYIPKSNDVAIVEEAVDNSDIKVYLDGLCFEGGIGVAAVLYRNGEEKEVVRAYFRTEDEHSLQSGTGRGNYGCNTTEERKRKEIHDRIWQSSSYPNNNARKVNIWAIPDQYPTWANAGSQTVPKEKDNIDEMGTRS